MSEYRGLSDDKSLPDADGIWVNEAELQQRAALFADSLKGEAGGAVIVIFMVGELGAGKSTFVRAVLRALGVQGSIKSPTFTLVETYTLPDLTVAHLDLYRLNDSEELEYLGFRDLLAESSLIFIEWPEKAIDSLPAPTIEIQLSYEHDGRRESDQRFVAVRHLSRNSAP